MKFSIIIPFIIAIDYISTVSAAIISSEASGVSEYASENAYIFLDSISNPKELHLQSALIALKLLTRADVRRDGNPWRNYSSATSHAELVSPFR